MTDVRDRLRDMFYAFLCYGGTQNASYWTVFNTSVTLFCVFMSRRCITLHLGEPECFVNEVCTACFASVVHRLCEFGAFLAQAVRIDTGFCRWSGIFGWSRFLFQRSGYIQNMGKMWVHFDPPKKKNPLRNVSEWVGSGDSRSRTDDPLLAKQML